MKKIYIKVEWRCDEMKKVVEFLVFFWLEYYLGISYVVRNNILEVCPEGRWEQVLHLVCYRKQNGSRNKRGIRNICWDNSRSLTRFPFTLSTPVCSGIRFRWQMKPVVTGLVWNDAMVASAARTNQKPTSMNVTEWFIIFVTSFTHRKFL